MSTSETLIYAFQITLIGMGLVFAALVLLWGLMALLVRAVPGSEDSDDPLGAETRVAATEEISERNLKHRAAAVAVSVALAKQGIDVEEHHTFPLPATAIVSAWQAVTRANQLNQKGTRR